MSTHGAEQSGSRQNPQPQRRTGWRAVLTNPVFLQRLHAASVVHWLVLAVPGLTVWRTNIAFLMYVSLATALVGSLAAYGSALAARKADPEDPL